MHVIFNIECKVYCSYCHRYCFVSVRVDVVHDLERGELLALDAEFVSLGAEETEITEVNDDRLFPFSFSRSRLFLPLSRLTLPLFIPCPLGWSSCRRQSSALFSSSSRINSKRY